MSRVTAAITVYLEPRVLAVLFLGFSSGIPLALTGQTLSVWMRERGISLATIGVFALVGLPYVLKFLWAPLIDALRVPLLHRWLGRRRAWLVVTQTALILSIAALGSNDPEANPALTAALALLVAFCSASQDIVVDAFRVESLTQDQLAAGMANYVAGYRVALLVSTAGAFEIAAWFQQAGLPGSRGWFATYAVLALLVLVGTAAILLSREPPAPEADAAARQDWAKRLQTSAIDPLKDLLLRPEAIAILLFIVLFKFGDAFAGRMTAPFVLDLGFDKQDYGRVVKVFGFAATLLGGFVGGSLFRLLGPVRGLWLGGSCEILSNLLMACLAQVGANLYFLIVTIGVENFCIGASTVIFVGYLSSLCHNRAYTATQYALLSALSAVSRTVLSAPAGSAAEWLGWTGFFLLAAAATIPGLVLLWFMSRKYGMDEISVPAG